MPLMRDIYHHKRRGPWMKEMLLAGERLWRWAPLENCVYFHLLVYSATLTPLKKGERFTQRQSYCDDWLTSLRQWLDFLQFEMESSNIQ